MRQPRERGALRGAARSAIAGWQIAEADLHSYIDGDPAIPHAADVEAFLAAHPLIAERVDTYRSHVVAVNAAFRGGDDSLPPALARLASRYARAVAMSAATGTALGIFGLIAILYVMTAQAHGG
jgi:anti-sigma factor RsiW